VPAQADEPGTDLARQSGTGALVAAREVPMTTQTVPPLFGFSARGWLALSVPVAVNVAMTLDMLVAPAAGEPITLPAPAEVTVVQAISLSADRPAPRALPFAVAAARTPMNRPRAQFAQPNHVPDGATAAERAARALALRQLDEVLAETVQTLDAAAAQARLGVIEYGDLPDLQREVLLQIEAVIAAQAGARSHLPESAHAQLDAKVGHTWMGPLERWQQAVQQGQQRLLEAPPVPQPAVELDAIE
jgi:hypothetical protein